MNPFHCSNCNKLLGKIDGKAEIKCPRCKTVNFTVKMVTHYRQWGWHFGEDGWMYTADNTLLGWVPPDHRNDDIPPLWQKPEDYYSHINSVDTNGYFINQ